MVLSTLLESTMKTGHGAAEVVVPCPGYGHQGTGKERERKRERGSFRLPPLLLLVHRPLLPLYVAGRERERESRLATNRTRPHVDCSQP